MVFLFDVKDSTRSVHDSNGVEQDIYYGIIEQTMNSIIASIGDKVLCIKSTGDGYYLYSEKSNDSLLLFMELNKAFGEIQHKNTKFQIRCGAGFGNITLKGDPPTDLQGDLANIVSRCCSNAKIGELVINDMLHNLISSSTYISHFNIETEYLEKSNCKGCENIKMWVIKKRAKTDVVFDAAKNHHIEFCQKSDDEPTPDSENYKRMFYNLKIKKKEKSEIVNDLLKCVATVSFIDKDDGKPIKQIQAHWEKNPEPRINEKFEYSHLTMYNEKDVGCTEQPFNILIKYDGDKGFYVADPWIIYKYPNNPREWEKEGLKLNKDEYVLRVEIKCNNLINVEKSEYLLKNKGTHKENIEIIRVLLDAVELVDSKMSQKSDLKFQSIENGIEKLYYPLQNTLKKSIVRFESIRKEINKIGNNKRMLEADLNLEQNKDVLNAWQIIIKNYYYIRNDFDKIIRFTYLAHSKNLEKELQEFMDDPGGDVILYLVDALAENWIKLDIEKIGEIRKNIDVDSFLAKMIDNGNNRRGRLTIMTSTDIERLKYDRNKLIEEYKEF